MIVRFGVVALTITLWALQRKNGLAFSMNGGRRQHLASAAFVTGHSAIMPYSKTFVASISGSFQRPGTELAMGKFEEFLTGRDDKSRKEDNDKYLAVLQKRVDKINSLESEIEELDDEELLAKTKEFQNRLKNGEDLNGCLLEEAFAVVREAAWYVLLGWKVCSFCKPFVIAECDIFCF